MSAVLFLCESPDLPEARLMAELVRRGLAVHAVMHPRSSRAGWLARQGVSVHPHAFPGLLDLRGPARVARLVRRHGIQLMHSLRGRAAFSLMMKSAPRARVKRVAWCDDTTPLGAAGGARAWKSSRLDAILASCHAVRIHLTDAGVDPARITTLYKGFDPSWYGPPADLREFNIPPRSVVVGYSGPLIPAKGVTRIAEIIRDLPPEPRFTFLCVGPVLDERLPDFAVRNRSAHQILVVGPRPDDAALMAACDLFLMPSIDREGLPRPLVEAMLAARPVVASAVDGLPELVEHQNSGMIVRPDSRRGLARTLLSLARNATLCQHLGSGAATRAAAKCSFAAAVDGTLDLYRRLGVLPEADNAGRTP